MEQNNFGQNIAGQDPVNQNLPGQQPVAQDPVTPISQTPNVGSSGSFPKSMQPTWTSPSQKYVLPDSKKDNRNLAIFAVVASMAVIAVIIFGVISLFSGSENDDSEDPAVTETPPLVEVQEAPIIGIEKDSILKSENSGLDFKTYFRVNTENEIGAVDVLTISFHPEKQSEVIVSTYDDGLFINEGTTNEWQWILFPPQKIYSFILDKANPDSRAFASGVISSNGRIFRTEDKGKTWRVVYAEPGNNTYVSALTQDPDSPNVILAGTNAGTLVRSTDGGDTWKNIGKGISGGIDHFMYEGVKKSMVYLLSRGKIYHSYDAGVTWVNWEEIKLQEVKDMTAQAKELSRAGDKTGAKWVNDQIAALKKKNQEEKTPSGIVKIVSDPNVAGVLYAGLSKGLYRSTDYGKYWKPVNIIESAEKFPIPSIAINPKDSNEISFVAGNTFYRSINYGVTWAVTPLDKTRNASFVAYDPFNPAIIYVGLSAKK